MDFDPAALAEMLGAQPGPDAQALALQRRLGMLGQLSGDKVLAPFGQSLNADVQAQIRNDMQRQLYANEAKRWQAQGQHMQNMDANRAGGIEAGKAKADAALVRQGLPPRFMPENSPVSQPQVGPPDIKMPGGPLRQRAAKAGKAPADPAVDLSPAALDALAEKSFRTGEIPNFGMGAAGIAKRIRVINRMSELHPGADLAGNKAGYHADTSSLGKQQQLFDLTKSWENTGKANLAVLKTVSQQLINTGSPWLNKPLRSIFQKASGDPAMVKFKAAHSAVVNEYAKILSGAMGSAGVTEGARHEAEEMLPLDSTPAQIAAAADILESDAGNRLASLERQLAETRERTTAKGPASEAPSGDKEALRKKYGL